MPPYRKSQRGWLTGDSLAPQTGRILVIPGDLAFLMAVNGALAELGMEHNWEQFGTVTPEDTAQAMRDMLQAYFVSEIPPEVEQMNTSLILFPASAFIPSGNAFVWFTSSTMELGGYWQQNPAQTADQFRWEQYIAPGNYNYQMTYLRQTTNGKGTFYITPDFSTFLVSVNIDFRGALLANQRFTGTFTVPEPGAKYIIGVDGTGASSGSSYIRPVQRLEMWRDS